MYACMLPLFRKIPTDNNAFIYRQYAVLKLNVLNLIRFFFQRKGEDRLFTTSMAVNTLINVWTYRANDGLVFLNGNINFIKGIKK